MKDYSVMSLDDYLKTHGEIEFNKLLDDFTTKKSQDVENFLKKRALKYSKENITKTYLLLTVDSLGVFNLLAYFSIVINKVFKIKGLDDEDKVHFTGDKGKVNYAGCILIAQIGMKWTKK